MDTIITERPEITIDDEVLSHSTSGHVGQQESLTPEEEAPKRRSNKKRSKLLAGASFSVVALAAVGVFYISPYNHFTMADAGRAVSHAEHVALQSVPSLSAAPPLAPTARLARAPEPSHVAALQSHPSLGGGDDMDQFLKLGNHGPVASAPSREMASTTPIAARPEPRPAIASPPKPSGHASSPGSRDGRSGPDPQHPAGAGGSGSARGCKSTGSNPACHTTSSARLGCYGRSAPRCSRCGAGLGPSSSGATHAAGAGGCPAAGDAAGNARP